MLSEKPCGRRVKEEVGNPGATRTIYSVRNWYCLELMVCRSGEQLVMRSLSR